VPGDIWGVGTNGLIVRSDGGALSVRVHVLQFRDMSSALARADEALGDWPSFLFLSPARNQRDDCPNFLAQLATTRAVLSVLASIATGTRPALPPGATEKDGFVELLEADGLKIRLRR
jgi:hypothetical protein